jgi:predicted molibdopterin-dependent oxidoreductase YjgC
MHVTACITEVTERMEIVAHDEELSRARRLIIELLLAQNKHDCMVCESNGICELQKYAYQLVVDPKNLRFPSPEYTEPVDDSSEVIIRDLNKCILCGRCVRACYETSVQKVLNFYGRGGIEDFSPKMNLIAGFSQPLSQTECVSCGACVQACPTGAITEKLAHLQGRTWEFEKIRTTCPYCGVGCQMELWVKDNKIVRVYGCEDAEDNKGALCVKGRFGLDFVNHPDRLSKPLIKRNGRFEKASWDEALDLVAGKFKELKDKYGGDALAGLSSAKCTNEENYLFQKFIRTCFGTNSVDHCARL